MDTITLRARQIARGIDAGVTRADEIAALLERLASKVEAQRQSITCIEFALEYYSVPDLYIGPPAPDGVILDGGLRARTALGMLKPGYLSASSSNYEFGDQP